MLQNTTLFLIGLATLVVTLIIIKFCREKNRSEAVPIALVTFLSYNAVNFVDKIDLAIKSRVFLQCVKCFFKSLQDSFIVLYIKVEIYLSFIKSLIDLHNQIFKVLFF